MLRVFTIMKKILNKKVRIIGIVILVIFIFCVILFAILHQEKHTNGLNVTEAVEVYVNGEALYTYEVDETLKLNPEVSREEVVENTIDDMLIIQYAREHNIDVSDEEVEYMLNLYQEHYPEIYEIALDGYGMESLKSGIKTRLLLSDALEMILSEPDYKIDESQEAIDEYLMENGIDPESLVESEYIEARNLYVKAQEIKMRETWLENARMSAEIIYSEESVD